MKLVKKLYDPFFLGDIRILVGTHKELRDWYDKNGVSGEREDNELLEAMVQIIDRKGRDKTLYREYVVYVEDKGNFYAVMHECVHLVAEIFKDRNVPLDLTNNQELFAYYHSYWFKRIWRLLAKIK